MNTKYKVSLLSDMIAFAIVDEVSCMNVNEYLFFFLWLQRVQVGDDEFKRIVSLVKSKVKWSKWIWAHSTILD
jgi:hypothetical protein